MQTKNFIFNGGSQRKPVKQSVDSIEHRILIFRFFLIDLIRTLISETEVNVNLTVFMITSDQVNLFRVHALKSQQETNCLKRMTSSVNEISQENVIVVFNIFFLSILVRRSIQFKEAHQICKLAMNIAEYFQRSLWSQNHWLVHNHLFCHVAKVMNMLWLKVNVNCFCVHKLLWL